MSDFLTGVKVFITTIVTTVTTLVAPATPVPSATPNPVLNPEFIKLASKSAVINSPQPTLTQSRQAPSTSQTSPKPQSSTLTLNEENYIYIQGTYSYLGQSIKYLALVPRKGGNFSAAVSGACEAQAAGDYEGGNGGKISGNASGTCNMFGVKLQGSTKFSGKLYPDENTIELDIENSPIHGFKIKYN